jgi:hypothetical protein
MFKVDSNGCMMEPCSVGIEETEGEKDNNREPHLFPNPAHQQLQVNLPGNPDAGTLQIFNALGKLVMILGVASEEESKTSKNLGTQPKLM